MTAILPQKSVHEPSGLYDNLGRKIDYLRLAITDRCNLRCRYCMPREGIRFVPYREILRYEEMVRLVRLFTVLGIRKIRITGGEPFARRDCLALLRHIRKMPLVEELHVTTNGVVTAEYLDELKALGMSGINLSLDTLDPQRFSRLSRKDSLDNVLQTFHGALQRNIPLKINSVVLEDTPDSDILAIAELARKNPITVRFIEKMPFSGSMAGNRIFQEKLVHRLRRLMPMTETGMNIPTTARLFSIKEFAGKIGIIEGHSRSFCHSCNKVRITPRGILKTCLYDAGVLDLKAMIRSNLSDTIIRRRIMECITNRLPDGRQVEKMTNLQQRPSMASIGG